MSKETRQWLAENTLIGFTDKRGNAWHYREGDANHYEGAIPVEDVQNRLFHWTAVESPMMFRNPVTKRFGSDQSRKVILRSDTGDVMGVFKKSYQPHQYGEWLLTNVANILDDDLGIGSAGLLRNGAVAWVSVEVPENITTPEGVEFRPNLLACTSFDGSLATTYKRIITNVVCDNTMAAALTEGGAAFRVRHSSKSLTRLNDARDALGIVHSISDDFAAEVAKLCATPVSDAAFFDFVDSQLAPIEEDAKKFSVTMAEKKRDAFRTLWTQDERVAPWRGNLFGAWQAVNTFSHHETNPRGVRAERIMTRTVEGRVEQEDFDALRPLLATV
ncbi:DUF932 domain-containing protein [Streptomyces sp. NPDC093261]|uniref:DUF932 domain-containing protein n=1 Tax=Streptomyces sp. NPDC093261 TaxID=3366037 RepID=UPI00380F34B6